MREDMEHQIDQSLKHPQAEEGFIPVDEEHLLDKSQKHGQKTEEFSFQEKNVVDEDHQIDKITHHTPPKKI